MSDTAGWPAPTPVHPVEATVRLPGSKSLTNRYLVLAGLADEPSRLRHPLRSRDTLLMAQALRELGAVVADDGEDWVVTPVPRPSGAPGPEADEHPVPVDCGLAGTVMRFLPPLVAVSGRAAHLFGDPRLHERPVAPLLQALRDLGVRVDDTDGGFPCTIHAGPVPAGGEVALDASASSQFVSGLLLAGARMRDGLVVRHVGSAVPSRPHVAMTVENLRDVGVTVDDTEDLVWRVAPGPVGGLDVDVEPDLSNAGPFLAAALVTGGTVHVPGWPQQTTQAGDVLRDVLDAMGADVRLDPDGLTVSGDGEVYGIDVDLHAAGEVAPTLAGLAALAVSPSRLRGIAHLRGHETDRLQALADEVGRLGGHVEVLEDGLRIEPRPLHGGRWHSYADHRMATTGAVVGLRVPGVVVDDVATTSKTIPDFVGLWTRMLDGR
ncbi:3-phosphoshikimate 1-carboxyvinyltransferase [Aquipuribacter nitratireducens]|uniref:3-phosphoshikimate 1-carboxyvinyltransferase n=1 Tax=Aquipuribacter nitratireducens TaxID=650104 RepID=A0ABW0GLN7_9MICO